MMKKLFNVAWVVIENMMGTRRVLDKPKYGDAHCTRRESFPYACHLKCIFQHFRISTKGYAKEGVKSLWVVRKESLKNNEDL